MDDPRRKFFDESSRLIDSVNRLMLFAALLVFYFLLVPILYKIEKSSRTTTVQVEALNTEVKTLEQNLLDRLENPEWWLKTRSKIMDRLTPSSESRSN